MRELRSGTLLALVFAGAQLASAADVAVLKSADTPAWRPAIDAIRRAAASHTLTEYDLKGDRAEAERVIGSLKGKPGVLVAVGELAAQAAHEVAPELPLIFCMVKDPVRIGLAGANVTGVAFAIPIKNQLAAFRLVNPRGVRIGVIYSDANTGRQVDEAVKAAGVVRLNVVAKPVASEKDVPEALRALLKGADAVDALWIPPDPILIGSDESLRYILAETLKAAKPIYSFSSALVTLGALVSNGPDVTSIGDQVGDLVNRVAGGEKGKIEMLIPRAELVVNKKIADKLKIEIPADALRAANKVL